MFGSSFFERPLTCLLQSLHFMKAPFKMSYLNIIDYNSSHQPEPAITISTATYLTCNSGSEARLKRIEGITTPKEFNAIVDAVAFAKTLEYPMTTELIQALSGIKRQSDNSRVVNLITSIIELNQLHDDIYTDDRCRKVYKNEDGKYVVNTDGEIAEPYDDSLIYALEKIDDMKKRDSVNNKSVEYVVSIVYKDYKTNTFINPLLSSSFLSSITNGVFALDNPIKFYKIDAYRLNANNYGIDAKWEKHKGRLIHYLIGSGLDKNMIFDLRNFADDIGMLFGYVALKHLPKYKRNLTNSRSIFKHGQHLFNLYIQTANKSGYVSSRSTGIQFFSQKTVVNWHMDFFHKAKHMMKNWHYIVYEPTDTINAVAEEVFDFVKELNFCEPDNKKIVETDTIFSFDFNKMMEISIRDRMSILAHSIGVKDGRVWVEINIKDNGFNRIYSLINTISSKSRLELHERDVGTAQQTIMMNIVDGSEKDYPLFYRLINDKIAFRNEVMELIGCDYDKAKEHITAITNGRDVNWYYKNKAVKKKLMKLYFEAKKLSQAFMYEVKMSHPFVYKQALALAKEADTEDFAIGGKRFYGVLAHSYTHFERQIRDAMKSCYAMPVYDVHDAVYSRETIEPDVLEKAVLDQTRFKVKI